MRRVPIIDVSMCLQKREQHRITGQLVFLQMRQSGKKGRNDINDMPIKEWSTYHTSSCLEIVQNEYSNRDDSMHAVVRLVVHSAAIISTACLAASDCVFNFNADPALLTRAAQDVQPYFTSTTQYPFQPVYAVIATWHNVTFKGSTSCCDIVCIMYSILYHFLIGH